MKTSLWFSALTALALAISVKAAPGVVINEVFYHAPDDLDDLEWIELHNPEAQQTDLSGWSLKDGVSFRFPAQTVIAAGGYLVVCKSSAVFKEFYDAPVAGEFTKSLRNSGETVELIDANGRTVDRVTFTDGEPWPIGPDGHGSSLERITPAIAGERAENWAPSPLPEDEARPAGTPGRLNANYSANFPPVISQVTVTPRQPAPDEVIKVQATVEDAEGVEAVEVRYTLARPGGVGEEQALSMKRENSTTFTAEIPGQAASQLLRFRIRAADVKKAERYFPPAHDLRPAISLFVHGGEKASISLAHIIHTDPGEHAAMERVRQRSLKARTGPFGRPEDRQLQGVLADVGNLKEGFFAVTIGQDLDHSTYRRLRQLFAAKAAERALIVEEALASDDAAAMLKSVPERLKGIQGSLVEELRKTLPGKHADALEQSASHALNPGQPDPAGVLKRVMDIASPWLALNLRFALSEAQWAAVRPAFQVADRARAERAPKVEALMRGQGNFMDLLNELGQVEKKLAEDLQGALSLRQRRFLQEWKNGQGSPIRPRLTEMRPRLPRGRCAFVFVDKQSGQREVYDFINITERSAGYKVRFHRDKPFHGMSSANVIFEYNDRFMLAEPLAFELYRQAENAACVTDFVRLTLNGHELGYHLLFEQVNNAFLERNRIRTGGELYKILWYGRGIEGQHEKQNNPDHDHTDLVKLVESLQRTTDAEQWQIIQKNFNVDQVINYFAVNMVLSHWDGFFNNYFAYQDRKGSGKWELYPWDQDKTWGFHDNSGEEVFYDMPLTFGMAGDRPPGGGEPNVNPGHWWRPAGYFSGPLLANPEFRQRFLARTRHILENVYTEAKFYPIIDQMAARLRPEIPLRARARDEQPDEAMKHFEANVASLKEHLVKRRTFLLDQPELTAARQAGASQP